MFQRVLGKTLDVLIQYTLQYVPFYPSEDPQLDLSTSIWDRRITDDHFAVSLEQLIEAGKQF
jgi:hypothetical protein